MDPSRPGSSSAASSGLGGGEAPQLINISSSSSSDNSVAIIGGTLAAEVGGTRADEVRADGVVIQDGGARVSLAAIPPGPLDRELRELRDRRALEDVLRRQVARLEEQLTSERQEVTRLRARLGDLSWRSEVQKKAIREVREVIECKVCYRVSGYLYSCENHHQVCAPCYMKLRPQICPVCRCGFTSEAAKSTWAAKAIGDAILKVDWDEGAGPSSTT